MFVGLVRGSDHFLRIAVQIAHNEIELSDADFECHKAKKIIEENRVKFKIEI